MKRKKTAKYARKTAKISRSIAKGGILIARVQTPSSKPNASVTRIQLQSVVARYRTTVARLNAKRHEVLHLQFKIRNLESRIAELEQQLTQRSTTQ